MARPDSGPPPVRQSAVAVRPPSVGIEHYKEIAGAFQRPDRRADLKAMLGSDDAVERFLAVALHAISVNSDILAADPMSVIQAVKDSAALGLEPTGLGGEGVIIVYGTTATFQPMWRGYLKRIRNSAVVQDIDCQLVYMADEFALSLGTEPSIHHVPALYGAKDEQGNPLDGRGDYRGAYAWAQMPSGKYIIEWAPVDDINHVMNTFSSAVRSKKKGNPWETSWGEMARKTVIKRLAKRLPQSAVDQLLLTDARADALADEENAKAAALDVSPARQAALAAVNRAAGVAVAEPLAIAPPEPEKAPEESEVALAADALPPEPTEQIEF